MKILSFVIVTVCVGCVQSQGLMQNFAAFAESNTPDVGTGSSDNFTDWDWPFPIDPFSDNSTDNFWDVPFPPDSNSSSDGFPDAPFPIDAPFPDAPFPVDAPFPDAPFPVDAPFPDAPFPVDAPFPDANLPVDSSTPDATLPVDTPVIPDAQTDPQPGTPIPSAPVPALPIVPLPVEQPSVTDTKPPNSQDNSPGNSGQPIVPGDAAVDNSMFPPFDVLNGPGNNRNEPPFKLDLHFLPDMPHSDEFVNLLTGDTGTLADAQGGSNSNAVNAVDNANANPKSSVDSGLTGNALPIDPRPVDIPFGDPSTGNALPIDPKPVDLPFGDPSTGNALPIDPQPVDLPIGDPSRGNALAVLPKPVDVPIVPSGGPISNPQPADNALPIKPIPVDLPVSPGNDVNDKPDGSNAKPVITNAIPLGPVVIGPVEATPSENKPTNQNEGNGVIPDVWMKLYPNGRPSRAKSPVVSSNIPANPLTPTEFWLAQDTLNSFSRNREVSKMYRQQRRDRAKESRRQQQLERRQNQQNRQRGQGNNRPSPGRGPKGAKVATMVLPNTRKPFVGKWQRGRNQRVPCTRLRQRRGLCSPEEFSTGNSHSRLKRQANRWRQGNRGGGGRFQERQGGNRFDNRQNAGGGGRGSRGGRGRGNKQRWRGKPNKSRQNQPIATRIQPTDVDMGPMMGGHQQQHAESIGHDQPLNVGPIGVDTNPIDGGQFNEGIPLGSGGQGRGKNGRGGNGKGKNKDKQNGKGGGKGKKPKSLKKMVPVEITAEGDAIKIKRNHVQGQQEPGVPSVHPPKVSTPKPIIERIAGLGDIHWNYDSNNDPVVQNVPGFANIQWNNEPAPGKK